MPPKSAQRFSAQDKWIQGVAADLLASQGKSIVTVGSRQPGVVHLLADAINCALGNVGTTVVALECPSKAAVGQGAAAASEPISISALVQLVRDSKIKNLFILGGNPVYNALANLDWPRWQKSVSNVFRLGYYEDETSALSHWHIPAAHYLESWGDARGVDGTYMAIQPMILPLFGGWSELDLLRALVGIEKSDSPDLIKDTFAKIANLGGDRKSQDFELKWSAFLRDGFLPNTAAKEMPARFNVGDAKSYVQQNLRNQLHSAPTDSELEVVLMSDYKVDDGRYINNGWLQEMPDPITKMSWDNAALMSLATGKRLGLKTGDVVQITANNRSLFAPILLAPGHVDNSISLALGYGREITGRVGDGSGCNAYVLRSVEKDGADCTYVVPGATVTKTSDTPFHFADGQKHQSMEGRNIVRELPKSSTMKIQDTTRMERASSVAWEWMHTFRRTSVCTSRLQWTRCTNGG